MSEHDEQCALFAWAKLQESTMPELWLLHAIPNAGKRSIPAARWMQAEGLKKGVLDICLPVARCGKHGLYLEMKFRDNQPTAEQRQWINALTNQGYLAIAVWGFEEAVSVILGYLEGKL